MEEFIVVRKSHFTEVLNTLEPIIKKFSDEGDFASFNVFSNEKAVLEGILKVSKPLQPIVENAFDAGFNYGEQYPEKRSEAWFVGPTKEEYTQNPKFG